MAAFWLLLLALPQDPWWHRDWEFRRPIVVAPAPDEALESGAVIEIDLDSAWLGLQAKSRKGLEDWVLVRGASTVPFALQPGKKLNAVRLAFRAPAIPAGGAERYHLYYGGPERAPSPPAPDLVHDFFDDFSDPARTARLFRADPAVRTSIEQGRFVIQDAPPGVPSRIVLLGLPRSAGFELRFVAHVKNAGSGFGIELDLEEAPPDPALPKRIQALVGLLGDDDFTARDRATKDLIAIGRPAVAALTAALRSDDAEMKWRAGHALKEIQEHSPAPRMRMAVGVRQQPLRSSLFGEIGRSRAVADGVDGTMEQPATVTIRRDADGQVEMSWGSRFIQKGKLPGKLREIAWSIQGPGLVFLDDVSLRPYVDDDARPTTRIDVEESRP